MFKLFKKFGAGDWLLILLLIAVVVVQVYFDLKLPDYTNEILNEVTSPVATTASIWRIGGKMMLVAFGAVACTIVIGFFASHLASKLARILRRDMFVSVNSFSGEEMNKFSTASLITRSTNDISQVQMAAVMVFRMAIVAPITAVWAIIKIQSHSLPLTLATGISIASIVVFIVAIFIVVMPRFKLVQRNTDRLNSVTRENLTGLRVVKAYNADSYQEEKFEKVNDCVLKNNVFINRIMSLIFPTMFLVMNAITLTIYWLGAKLINNGDLNIGEMGSFTILAMQVLMSFMMLTMLFLLLPRASVSARRIIEVLETEPAIKDGSITADVGETGRLEFRNVGFRYPDSSANVLEDISFTAEKGETVAFIGSTGSGKSTLINLIPRFFDATQGEIIIDGINIKDMKQSFLRSKLGYVPQKGVLFSGTVRSNIGYGREVSVEKMQFAARCAKADEFIERLEDGYDGAISQGGKNVSGGQKQRLSIARAVAVEPEIFIFDDSFSALDYKTDKEVRKTLKEGVKDAIVLIVAQRIGTIMDADKIVVLENGRMVGCGVHKELLKTCDVYREIAESQLSKEELGL